MSTLPQFIWHQGTIKPWAEATTHVMAHALHYGSCVFEGIRAYATPKGPMIFRLQDHLKRLFASARIYDIEMPYDQAALSAACKEVIRVNQYAEAYLRPFAYRGPGGFGLGADNPTEVSVATWPWGTYLGAEALNQGIDVCVSSWQRVAPNTLPAAAKAAGNYLSSILIVREAKRLGFHEGIALTVDGFVSEGSGENVFVVMGKTIYTPPLAASILHGLTRDTIITLAKEAGLEVKEMPVTREMLYLCDELFLVGTAAEVTPVRSVDRKAIQGAVPGPITKLMQARYFGLVKGTEPDRFGWLEGIDAAPPKGL
jgi:branched-chain amino acid aminotransferase